MDQRLKQVVANVLHVSPEHLTLESSPANVGSWDSLATINLVVALEVEFGISFSADDIGQFTSLQSVCNIVQRHVE